MLEIIYHVSSSQKRKKVSFGFFIFFSKEKLYFLQHHNNSLYQSIKLKIYFRKSVEVSELKNLINIKLSRIHFLFWKTRKNVLSIPFP